MKIGGFQGLTLMDYPGHTAAIVFTQGCNFRCPFCHNGSLIPANGGGLLDQDSILARLERRRGLLDGVVVSGGEPTIQEDLSGFLERLKVMGFLVKLDTNGSRPDVLRRVLGRGLVDYVAMDVKAPLDKYPRLAGIDCDRPRIEESIGLIASSGIDHQFRTTWVEALLTSGDIERIRASVPEGSDYRVQVFVMENALDSRLRKGMA